MRRGALVGLLLCGELIWAGTAFAAPAPEIIVTKTNGFIGISQRVEVAADGAWTFIDDRGGATETGTFDPGQRAELHALATSDELRVTPTPDPGGRCADYFIYGITVEDTTVNTDDCGRPPNDAAARITAIVVDATPL